VQLFVQLITATVGENQSKTHIHSTIFLIRKNKLFFKLKIGFNWLPQPRLPAIPKVA